MNPLPTPDCTAYRRECIYAFHDFIKHPKGCSLKKADKEKAAHAKAQKKKDES